MYICNDCYKELEKIALKTNFPHQLSDMSIEDYSKIFKQFMLTSGSFITADLRDGLFVVGLSENNKRNIRMFPFNFMIMGSDDFIDTMVYILSSMEKLESKV